MIYLLVARGGEYEDVWESTVCGSLDRHSIEQRLIIEEAAQKVLAAKKQMVLDFHDQWQIDNPRENWPHPIADIDLFDTDPLWVEFRALSDARTLKQARDLEAFMLANNLSEEELEFVSTNTFFRIQEIIEI